MSPRAWPRSWVLALALALCGPGCGPDEVPSDPEPPVEGELIYATAVSGLCGLGPSCWQAELYRLEHPSEADLAVIELRISYAPATYVGLNRGVLSSASVDALDEHSAALEAALAGGLELDTWCVAVDSPAGEFYFEGEAYGYGLTCINDEALALHTLLTQILFDLMTCTPSPRISPEIGCEPYEPFG